MWDAYCPGVAKKISVIGFDINDERIGLMRKNIDPSGELDLLRSKELIYIHNRP